MKHFVIGVAIFTNDDLSDNITTKFPLGWNLSTIIKDCLAR